MFNRISEMEFESIGYFWKPHLIASSILKNLENINLIVAFYRFPEVPYSRINPSTDGSIELSCVRGSIRKAQYA